MEAIPPMSNGIHFPLSDQMISSPPVGGCQIGSTASVHWHRYQYPDFVMGGSSDQKVIMEAICKVKKATFDGMNCIDGDPDATGKVRS